MTPEQRYDRLQELMREEWNKPGGMNGEQNYRALARLVDEVREEDCKAVRAACGPCKGTGALPFIASEPYIDEHGDQIAGLVEATECEYCGRPIAAIRATT